MASVDRIVMQIPADRRLARVVKAAVSYAAREAGIPRVRATAFAAEVAGRFSGLSAKAAERTAAVDLTLEPVRAGLDVQIRKGARRLVLKVRLQRRSVSRRPAVRRSASRRR